MNGPSNPKAPILFKGPDSNEAVIDTPCIREPPRGDNPSLLCQKTDPDTVLGEKHRGREGIEKEPKEASRGIERNRLLGAYTRICALWTPVHGLNLALTLGKLHSWRKRPHSHACVTPSLVRVLLPGPLALRGVLMLFPSSISGYMLLSLQRVAFLKIPSLPQHTYHLLKFLLKTVLTHLLFGNSLLNSTRGITSLTWRYG